MYIYIVLQLDVKLDAFSENSFPIWGHASVRHPGVLHTNVGHSKFGYRTFKKIIQSDISAFVQGHYQVCWWKLLRVKWWIFSGWYKLLEFFMVTFSYNYAKR